MTYLPSPYKNELLLREYGQSTYELVQTLHTIEDKAERTRRAQQIVQLIFRLNPSLRDQPDAQQKVWHHLFVMADENLDVDSPFPLKSLDLEQEPERVPYPKEVPKLKAYGRGVELLIEKALTLEDPAEREQATIAIGRTMKFLYRSHNKENAKDVTILKHLKELSGGKLELDPAQVEAQNLFEFATAGRPAPFIVPQPRNDRSERNDRGERSDRGDREMRRGGNNRRDKQRRGGKKRQEPQQPPQ